MSPGKLRVLALAPDYPPAFGGIQLLCHRVLSHLTGTELRVVTLAPPAGRESIASEPHVRRAPRAPDHRLEVLLMNGLALREAQRFRPHLVLCAHIVATPAGAAISRRHGVPSVVYAHGKEVGSSPALARFGLRRSAAIIAVSRYTRSLAIAAGAPPGRIHVIPPGVDLVPAPSGPKLQRPTIITVARLEDPYKGHDVIVRALPLIRARVPDVQWVVIGDGRLREEIQRLAEANGVSDAVLMLGSIADRERNAWLDGAHVFTMPSRLPAGRAAGEGFGIVYLEAGVHRLPVVAGAVGGALDAVVQGVTGVLVDPSSCVALADAIADLLLDPDRAARLGQAGRVRSEQFSWSAIASRVEALLFSAAGRPR